MDHIETVFLYTTFGFQLFTILSFFIMELGKYIIHPPNILITGNHDFLRALNWGYFVLHRPKNQMNKEFFLYNLLRILLIKHHQI